MDVKTCYILSHCKALTKTKTEKAVKSIGSTHELQSIVSEPATDTVKLKNGPSVTTKVLSIQH